MRVVGECSGYVRGHFRTRGLVHRRTNPSMRANHWFKSFLYLQYLWRTLNLVWMAIALISLEASVFSCFLMERLAYELNLPARIFRSEQLLRKEAYFVHQ